MEDKDLRQEPLICLVCAWRETCLKKFSLTGNKCLDFCRDVTVKLDAAAERQLQEATTEAK